MDETEASQGEAAALGQESRHLKNPVTTRYSDMSATYVPKEPLHGLHVDMKVRSLQRIY